MLAHSFCLALDSLFALLVLQNCAFKCEDVGLFLWQTLACLCTQPSNYFCSVLIRHYGFLAVKCHLLKIVSTEHSVVWLLFYLLSMYSFIKNDISLKSWITQKMLIKVSSRQWCLKAALKTSVKTKTAFQKIFRLYFEKFVKKSLCKGSKWVSCFFHKGLFSCEEWYFVCQGQ